MNIVTQTANPAVDKSSAVDQAVPERKLRCDPPTYEPGGGGINVSRAISRLGGSSLALYASGGALGLMLQELLDREGIEHRPVKVSGLVRENLIVFEKSSGQQFRFGMPGPAISSEECEDLLNEVSSLDPHPEYLVASGSLPGGAPGDFYARVAEAGKSLGARVIVDTSGEPLEQAAKEGVFLLKPNLRELKSVSGLEGRKEAHVREMASELISSGRSEAVLVSLGAQGALLVTANEHHRIQAPLVPIQSKVGAGDSMVGGMVMKLAGGSTLLEAATYGVAAGTAAVMTPGTGLCKREDTDKLFSEMMRG